MVRFSPKLEIINHYDNLINRIDIEIEKCLEVYTNGQVLGNFRRFWSDDIIYGDQYHIIKLIENEKMNEMSELWSKSTKVVDYLNHVRKQAIDYLRQAQEDSLKDASRFSSLAGIEITNYEEKEELKRQVFGNRFCFQLNLTANESLLFRLYTFVTDFYLSPSEIDLLDHMINGNKINTIFFNEKMLLIVLLHKYFCLNFKTKNYHNHFIHVSKQDVSKVKQIVLTYCASGVKLTNLDKLEQLVLHSDEKLEEITIEGLSSLQFASLHIRSVDHISIKDLPAMKELSLEIQSPGQINSDLQTIIFDHIPNIERLSLHGNLGNFSLDSFTHLKKLSLIGNIINFDLFKNICKQLVELSIVSQSFNNNNISNMFYGHHFPLLSRINVSYCQMTKLEKTFFDCFPLLETLAIAHNNKLREIDHDAFSNLKQLKSLYLDYNCIESLDRRHFSELVNLDFLSLIGNPLKRFDENMFLNLKKLEYLKLSDINLEILDAKSFGGLENLKYLDLSRNKLKNFDVRILDTMPQIKQIDLSFNSIVNKEEILNSFKEFKFKF